MREKNVHTEHCCSIHGCKYGDFDCPVWLGYQKQTYPCESCAVYDGEAYTDNVPEETLIERRNRAQENYNYPEDDY